MCWVCLLNHDANMDLFAKHQRGIMEERRTIAAKPVWTKPDLSWLMGVSEKKVERMEKFDGLPACILPNEKGNARFKKVYLRESVLKWLKERETITKI